MLIIDVADDLGASFKRFIDQVGADQLADTVKTASWLEPGVARDRDYALILVDDDGSSHRKYACHDPGSTLVSMFYLQQAAPLLNPAAVKVAAANLGSLAKDWGLDVPHEITKLASTVLPEGAEKDILDARRVRFHPQKVAAAPAPSGPFEKLASAKLAWHDMTPQQRRVAACELVKEASTTPIVVPHEMFRYTGEKVGSKFAYHMGVRVEHCQDPEIAEQYKELAKTASLFPPDNVVDALYILDDAAHLRWAGGSRYGELIADPVLAVYDHNKEAAFVWNEGGDSVTEHDLLMFRTRESAREYFTSTFTDALWEKYEKDPVGTFKSMPTHQKVLLSRLARME